MVGSLTSHVRADYLGDHDELLRQLPCLDRQNFLAHILSVILSVRIHLILPVKPR